MLMSRPCEGETAVNGCHYRADMTVGIRKIQPHRGVCKKRTLFNVYIFSSKLIEGAILHPLLETG